jgi:hypothetical protein
MGGEVRWQVARMTDARPHAHGQEGTATAFSADRRYPALDSPRIEIAWMNSFDCPKSLAILLWL